MNFKLRLTLAVFLNKNLCFSLVTEYTDIVWVDKLKRCML